MNVKRISQRFAVSDTPIYVNSDFSKMVEKTNPEAHRLLVWSGQPFPIEQAIKLGLLTEKEPIALKPLTKPDEAQTKVVEAPDETKVVEAKHKK